MTILLLLLVLPGILELLLTASGALLSFFTDFKEFSVPHKGKIAVVIPAHNEEKLLPETLDALLRAQDPYQNAHVVVIADHCNDRTAEIAKARGVHVIVREERLKRGKGAALEESFQVLLKDGFDLFAVIDADTLVSPYFYSELRRGFGTGADALQFFYRVGNPRISERTLLMHLGLTVFNGVRPMGRQFWGLSAGITGNGFALSRKVIEEVPFNVSSIVEDLVYHHRLVAQGFLVKFLSEAYVESEMPSFLRAAETQRIRWEGGRLGAIVEQTPQLLKGIFKGNLRLIEPLFELLTLPLSYFLPVLVILAVFGSGFVSFCALLGLFAATVNLALGVKLAGLGWQDLHLIGFACKYIYWKLSLLSKIFQSSRRKTAWVRTDRS